MASTTEVDKNNIIEATADHLPDDIRQLLEERKKKCDEEDVKAALESIKVDRRGKSLRSRTSSSPLPPRMHLLR